jgi:hypothetical protein
VRDQERDVLPALPERRDLDREDAEAVVEVGAEAALAHLALEVPVRRRDHPHVHPALALRSLAELPVGRNRVYGFGPELSLPIATSEKLIAILNARYVIELGARTSLEGSTFQISATFPIPSISLQ